jgi:hypothetical protein
MPEQEERCSRFLKHLQEEGVATLEGVRRAVVTDL